jgi:hypothetical protein
MRNFVGQDGSKFNTDGKGDYVPIGANKNTNVYREDLDGELKGIYMNSTNVDPTDPAWGTIALTTLVDSSSTNVTYRLSSISNAWNHAILDFWDDVNRKLFYFKKSFFLSFSLVLMVHFMIKDN